MGGKWFRQMADNRNSDPDSLINGESPIPKMAQNIKLTKLVPKWNLSPYGV